MDSIEAKVGFTVKEWFWTYHPGTAEYLEDEPETVANFERWIDVHEKAHRRAPLLRWDGTRVYDAFALGWAHAAWQLNANLWLYPAEITAMMGVGSQASTCSYRSH